MIGKGGEPLIRKGVDMAMRLMGEQFVTGETIPRRWPTPQRSRGLPLLVRHARRSGDDRGRRAALLRVLRAGDPRDRQGRGGRGIYEGPGISIKLSALHARYSARSTSA
jgi:RHH-type proline utilization regulon transcriptional repressor/proline dehydrogenase/delta 1-pyrroline-5-carboxylate dehydrogenase